MSDQAHALRMIVTKQNFAEARREAAASVLAKNCRVITVTSGKGGVGKTSLVVNLATCLSSLGKKVAVLDADLGLANVDIMLGISPAYTLKHFINGTCRFEEIMTEGPSGITIIPGASGLPEMADLDEYQRSKILGSLGALEDQFDFLLIDTGAGINRSVLSFALAAEEVLVVTTPEPTAVTDAYGIIKTILEKEGGKQLKLILNMVNSRSEGEAIGTRLGMVVKEFTKKSLVYLGSVTMDQSMKSSIKMQQPVTLSHPRSDSARDLRQIAQDLAGATGHERSRGLRGFLNRLLGAA